MENKTNYVKRTQKDYSLSFKHQVVFEVESGAESTTSVQRKYGIQSRSTVVSWLRKFGTFDWENQIISKMPKSAEAKIKELEAKIKLLEKQKKHLKKEAEFSSDQAAIFDLMIELAEKEYNIDIRKNSSPESLTPTQHKNKKA
ncbi:hypothetical protein NHN08_04740 [Riemerella anatipestifer]|uniref:hypothetical protein n=1 Tax=Riemerella anatipestifer TaxID=34085 RepID=UPI002097AD8F|nr:hypothetical protein [Riemerella anatipestifer]MCO7331805.1 hypothetical protein [Riemerella anatipestifer]MCO7350692.1 hypothetical protein [Riemerella anatipestifer]